MYIELCIKYPMYLCKGVLPTEMLLAFSAGVLMQGIWFFCRCLAALFMNVVLHSSMCCYCCHLNHKSLGQSVQLLHRQDYGCDLACHGGLAVIKSASRL